MKIPTFGQTRFSLWLQRRNGSERGGCFFRGCYVRVDQQAKEYWLLLSFACISRFQTATQSNCLIFGSAKALPHHSLLLSCLVCTFSSLGRTFSIHRAASSQGGEGTRGGFRSVQKGGPPLPRSKQQVVWGYPVNCSTVFCTTRRTVGERVQTEPCRDWQLRQRSRRDSLGTDGDSCPRGDSAGKRLEHFYIQALWVLPPVPSASRGAHPSLPSPGSYEGPWVPR